MTYRHDRSQARRGVTLLLILSRTGNKGENQTVLLHNVAKFNLCVLMQEHFYLCIYLFSPRIVLRLQFMWFVDAGLCVLMAWNDPGC